MIIAAFVALLCLFIDRMVAAAGGPDVTIAMYLPNVQFFMVALLAYVCCAVAYLLVRHKPAEPLQFLSGSQPALAFWKSVANGFPLILAVSVFMMSFSIVKSSIPLVTSYTWDETFIAMDRTLHGTDPWRLLQPLLGSPLVTATLAELYHLWFLLIYAGSMFFALLVKDRQLRYRYFFAYILTWTIGGMAMAVGFASVGPCFLQPLTGNAYFADQMQALYAADAVNPVAVLDVQESLLVWYNAGNFGLGRGISAMPSMHVALAFLFYLGIRRISRAAGWFFGAFAAVIFVSSIHLGYHYAVDGYASLLLVGTVWWLVGKALPFLMSEPAAEPGPHRAEPALATAQA